jgi:hypothetical protein
MTRIKSGFYPRSSVAQFVRVFLDAAAELNQALQITSSFLHLVHVDRVWILDRWIRHKASDLITKFDQRIFDWLVL